MKRLAALLPLLGSVANAQCVMCFRTAASQNIARQQVMNSGILVMMVPPFVIFGGFLLLCWHRSQTFADTPPEEPVGQDGILRPVVNRPLAPEPYCLAVTKAKS